jgi:hypothetical protein
VDDADLYERLPLDEGGEVFFDPAEEYLGKGAFGKVYLGHVEGLDIHESVNHMITVTSHSLVNINGGDWWVGGG